MSALSFTPLRRPSACLRFLPHPPWHLPSSKFWAGAGYLVYLGLQSLGAKNQPHAISRTVATNSYQAFTKAMITGILNPKVALFFLAFLPQFVNPARGFAFWQFLTLGTILALLDTGYETMLAIVASTLSQRLILNPHFMLWRQRLTGAVLVGLGVRLALTQRI